MLAHGREVHDALNKARHGCERRPCLVSTQCLHERAVSREPAVSQGDADG